MDLHIEQLVQRALFPSMDVSVSMGFLYKKVVQQWQECYSHTVFTPLEYLNNIPPKVLVRAEPFIRLIYNSGVIQHGATTRVQRVSALIEEYLYDKNKTWGQTFDFVKNELGEMNTFLPLAKIPHIAEEELPCVTFALADTLEEMGSSSSVVDWMSMVEGESHNFTEAYRHRFCDLFGTQAEELLQK